jgi:hypothetical protein
MHATAAAVRVRPPPPPHGLSRHELIVMLREKTTQRHISPRVDRYSLDAQTLLNLFNLDCVLNDTYDTYPSSACARARARRASPATAIARRGVVVASSRRRARAAARRASLLTRARARARRTHHAATSNLGHYVRCADTPPQVMLEGAHHACRDAARDARDDSLLRRLLHVSARIDDGGFHGLHGPGGRGGDDES